ncbi:MAG: cell envelope biogenesis protein TolA [Beijerinckiaceae bacterium]
MNLRRGPGWVVSAVAHGALLAGMLVALPDARKYTDAQETVPVEILTEEQFNQVVKGDKQAKEQLPTPKVDKEADVAENNPEPPIDEAKKNIPTPPPPLKRQIDPGEDDAPKPAEPPKVAALPPPRPEPETKPEPEPEPAPVPPPRPPEQAKEAAPEPPKPVEKEAIAPLPPVRPKIEPKPEPKPEPKKVAAVEPEKPVVEKPEKVAPPVPLPPRRPRHLPRTPPKPQPDRLAKLIEKRLKEDKQAAKPKSGDEANEPRKLFDSSAISQLLSKEKAQRRASTGRQVQRQARLGSATASAAKMSPSLWGQLDGLMQEQYKRCWSYLGIASGTRYIPQIRVSYEPTGRLSAQPVLLNPPSDPAMQPLAESAVRAVRKCNPLRIPAQFAPYYEQWKARILRFDPEEMMG